jgi:hypothetical protein
MANADEREVVSVRGQINRGQGDKARRRSRDLPLPLARGGGSAHAMARRRRGFLPSSSSRSRSRTDREARTARRRAVRRGRARHGRAGTCSDGAGWILVSSVLFGFVSILIKESAVCLLAGSPSPSPTESLV